eukprot:m.839745 g.839745  ORF g.839745 m.839745 type:complete len:118 (-) comp23468_c0_seq2:3330-3683(-)
MCVCLAVFSTRLTDHKPSVSTSTYQMLCVNTTFIHYKHGCLPQTTTQSTTACNYAAWLLVNVSVMGAALTPKVPDTTVGSAPGVPAWSTAAKLTVSLAAPDTVTSIPWEFSTRETIL